MSNYTHYFWRSQGENQSLRKKNKAARAGDGVARQAKPQADYCVTSLRQFFICNFRVLRKGWFEGLGF
jgi:hypothetical protein